MRHLIDVVRCVFLLPIFAVSATNAASILYVANSSGNTVVRFDSASNTIIGAPIIVSYKPLAPVASADGTRVYVQSAADGSIAVIDARSATVATTLPNPNLALPQAHPAAIALSPDGKNLYVAASGGVPVLVLDAPTGFVVAKIPVPASAGSDPSQLVASHDGKRVYLAYQEHRTVIAIDTSTNNIVDQLAIPGPVVAGMSSPGIYGLATSTDDNTLYVTGNEGTLIAISAAQMSMTSTVRLSAPASGISVAPDGSHVYLGASGGACLEIVDVATSVVSGTGIGNNACGQVAVSSDGREVYVNEQDSLIALEPDGFTFAASPVGLISPLFTSQSLGPSAIYPTAGLWFNPQESGRGFSIETQGDTLVFIASVYDHSGAATWFIASGPYDASSGIFAGTLDATQNGQCLGCSYQAPTYLRAVGGTVGIVFSTPNTGTLFFSGGSTPIQKEVW